MLKRYSGHEPVAGPTTPVLAWEHHVLVAKTPEDFNRMADDLGRDSWELVSVVTRQNAHRTEWLGFFKTPQAVDFEQSNLIPCSSLVFSLLSLLLFPCSFPVTISA